MPTESGIATAPDLAPAAASINVLVLPADGSDPRLERIETVREGLIPSTSPPDDLYLGSTIRRRWKEFQQDVAITQIFMHWVGPSQPAVELLPDTRKKHWPAEAWEKRGAWGFELDPKLDPKLEPRGSPLRHCFFTMHTDNLERNEHVANHVSGDVFVLRVSDTLDENGRGFYMDTTPEDLSPKLVAVICDRVAEGFRTSKELDDCCQQMSIGWRVTAHSGLKWIGKWIHAIRTASIRNCASTTV